MNNLLLWLLSISVCIGLLLMAFRRKKPQRSMLTPVLGDIQKVIDESILFEPVVKLDLTHQHSFDSIVEPLFATEPFSDLKEPFKSNPFAATTQPEPVKVTSNEPIIKQSPIIAFYLMAPEGKQFFGYELLQALLSAGLRYGKMNIFHRYEDNGSDLVLFSVASAVEPGVFDLDNMGAFSCPGLSLFIRASGEQELLYVQLDSLLQTAEQLADDLGGILCDDQRMPLTEEKIEEYLERFVLAAV